MESLPAERLPAMKGGNGACCPGGTRRYGYRGHAYGTWMAVRLINEMDPESDALKRAIVWLEVEAGRDAKLAIDIGFDILSLTALSTSRKSAGTCDMRRKLVAELLRVQADDGGWDSDPIIRMDVRGVAVQHRTADPPFDGHGTRGLTTCVALLALLANEATH